MFTHYARPHTEILTLPPSEADGSIGSGNDTPFRVIIVESPEQSANAKEREQKSDAHESADLDAQNRAADAAQRSAVTAARQEVPTLLLAIAGTVIAVIALGYTIVSNWRSERIARAQSRAYLNVEKTELSLDAEIDPITVTVPMLNSGTTHLAVMVVERVVPADGH